MFLLSVSVIHLFRLTHACYYFFYIAQGNHLAISSQFLGQQFRNTAFDIVYNLVRTSFLAEMRLQIHQIIIQQTVGIFIDVEHRSAQIYSQSLFHCDMFVLKVSDIHFHF